MTANYPLNCWYVAATSDEVTAAPIARTLLGEQIVLFRQSSGDVVALEDRCIHRGFPLSRGAVIDDEIVCGYHGFTYEASGQCVRVPSQATVPANARVRAYPVIEQAPFIWIWTGNPRSATLRQPPATAVTDPAWVSTGTYMRFEANFMVIHEHYLDLTHAFVLHPQAVPPGLESLPPLTNVTVSEMSVSYHRTLPPARPAAWEQQATGIDAETPCMRLERGSFVSPAVNVEGYDIVGADGSNYRHVRVHAVTPESETSTHVWMRLARDYALDDTDVTDHLERTFVAIAERDRGVLELVQRQRGEQPARQVNVVADRAATQARRVVQAMVAEEAGRSASRPRYQS
jgi:phenylpropionate dioxygenase-like ring-hydroxylating dioxygenase large terminal subunit